MMTTAPLANDSLSKLLPSFEQCFPLLQFPDSSSIPYFLNNANVSKITGQIPDHRDGLTRQQNSDEVAQSPIYLSNFQPNLAAKETFMQNSFSIHNPADPSLAVNSSPDTYSTVNQCPESRASSEPSPSKDIHRQKVVPINGTAGAETVEETREMSALYSEIKLMSHQISNLKADLQVTRADLQVTRADLQVAQAEVQAVKQIGQRTHNHVLQFEQRQQQQAIEQCKIRLAQDQQLERRLAQSTQDIVKKAVHNAVERFLRVRSSVAPEPLRQSSTYSVPNRLNTGIYS
jgi:hypothetical protein